MAMRADARRNLEQLLLAARDVFVEKGPNAPLEEVAARAGVGVGTLYRRFPDRGALLRAVVVDALERTREAAEQAAERAASAFEALETYLEAALELRVSAVIPVVLDVLDLEEPAVSDARRASADAFARIVDAAHADGSLAPDVTFADIGMMLVRIARPLPGPFDPELKHELARRHLELFVRALRAPAEHELGGPALEAADLADLTPG